MSTTELILKFSGCNRVRVLFGGTDSGEQAFQSPVTAKDYADIRWYIETYARHSLADPDDAEGKRIAARLPKIGEALFNAVFTTGATKCLFDEFQNAELKLAGSPARVLTIDAADAAIRSLPWELLRNSAPSGAFLYHENPPISIRRHIGNSGDDHTPLHIRSKDRLHLLFVVSRPQDTGFMDPRSDPRAVLDALDQNALGRVTYEFLRPATPGDR